MFPAAKELSLLCLLFPLLWSAGYGIVINCEEREVCNECISLDSECMWCADEGVRRDSRCQESFDDCGEIFDPKSEIDNEDIDSGGVVPELYEISLRPGDRLTLPINVTTARTIPLDVYIVFDHSQSLQEEIEATRLVSDQIIDSLRNITDNVTGGFGSFIDKKIRPFTRTRLDGECIDGETCYNFRNYGPLTSDQDELNQRFQNAETGSNIDAPESGLDALAQISICDDVIGWRENAVKVILYFTDDAFKFAGEGRHAGIIKPFEEVCKLEIEPGVTEYTSYSGLFNDYTSPGQLLKLLEENNVVPVFIAVTSETQAAGHYNVFDTHMALAEMFNIRLNNRASAAELDGLSTNDPAMVAEVAQNILSTIDEQVLAILELTRLIPETLVGIESSVEAECPPGAVKLGEGTNAQYCVGVNVGNTTEFFLNLTLESCDVFGTEPRVMNIEVLPLGEARVVITPICTCDCNDTEVNSPRCSFNGNYSCGECTCEEGYCGLRCQIREDVQSECPVAGDGEICSGGERGTCLTCECVCQDNVSALIDEEIRDRVTNFSTYGPACECDYFSCLKETDPEGTELCSGKGMCCDGMCICDEDTNGYEYRSDSSDNTDCDCEPAEVICLAPGSSEQCEGRGTCECLGCSCSVPYIGKFCKDVELDNCFDLATETEIQMCILDEKDRDDEICQECVFDDINEATISCVLIIPQSEQPVDDESDKAEAIIIEYAEENLPGTKYGYILSCTFTDDDGCLHNYHILYNIDDFEDLVFVAEEQRTCPASRSDPLLSIPLWALAVILLGLLLLLGIIILIIIKVVFLLLDYFEVKRLEKEVGMADFSKNQNPLYQSPDVEYKNVAYGKE